eukprot:PhM_4_TR2016/c0_g1_i1/m.18968
MSQLPTSSTASADPRVISQRRVNGILNKVTEQTLEIFQSDFVAAFSECVASGTGDILVTLVREQSCRFQRNTAMYVSLLATISNDPTAARLIQEIIVDPCVPFIVEDAVADVKDRARGTVFLLTELVQAGIVAVSEVLKLMASLLSVVENAQTDPTRSSSSDEPWHLPAEMVIVCIRRCHAVLPGELIARSVRLLTTRTSLPPRLNFMLMSLVEEVLDGEVPTSSTGMTSVCESTPHPSPVPSDLNSQKSMHTPPTLRPQPLPPPHPSTVVYTKVSEKSVFASCGTMQERRQLGTLLINKALQGSDYRDTYAAARRRVSSWMKENAISEEDSVLLLHFLSDSMLAGERFTAVTEEGAVGDGEQNDNDDDTGAGPQPQYLQMPTHIVLGDRVRVQRYDQGQTTHMGQVRYIGFPDFNKGAMYKGAWVGVALDTPDGNHNGSVNDVAYFVCKPKHGLFVRSDRVEAVRERFEGPRFFYPQANTGALLQFDVRKRVFKPFGFLHGDVVTATLKDLKYRPTGTIIGVRGEVLWWHMEGMDGAVPCRNTAQEVVEVFQRKKYKKVGHKEPKNHADEVPCARAAPSTPTGMTATTTGAPNRNQAQSPADGIRGVPAINILPQPPQEVSMLRVKHLVNPLDTFKGVLRSPSLSDQYQLKSPSVSVPASPASSLNSGTFLGARPPARRPVTPSTPLARSPATAGGSGGRRRVSAPDPESSDPFDITERDEEEDD